MTAQAEEQVDRASARAASPTPRFLQMYTIGAAIVWAGLFVAVAFVLKGSDFFAQLLPILTGAMAWFVIIVPAAASRSGRLHRKGGQRLPAG